MALTEWQRFLTDPLNVPRKLLGINTLWWGAEKIINSVFENRKTAVQAGHSLSKDWAAGIITITWLLKYFGNAKVILTAPTDRQVREIMFSEIEKQYIKLCGMHQGFRLDALTDRKLNFGSECFAIGFTTTETGDKAGKFQGFKSQNLLIIITEAQDIPSSIFRQIRGLMTSSNSRILELANPIVPYGDFYEHCTNPKLGYNVIKLSCFDSPNVIAGREVLPGLVTKEFVDDMRRAVGEDDPEWQSRVLGEFPQYSTRAWIPLAKITEAVNRRVDLNDNVRVGGLDTARLGEDETVYCVLHGCRQVKQDTDRKALTGAVIGWMRKLIEDEKLAAVAIDEGYNPGVGDILTDENMPVTLVGFGKTSPDERFENFGTYMWWLLREAFMNDQISIMDDPVLVSQLASRKVEMTPKGKRKLESKKTSGQKSPDRADALAMAWYMRLTVMGGLGLISTSEEEANEAASLQDMISSVVGSAGRTKRNSPIDDIGVVEANSIRY